MATDKIKVAVRVRPFNRRGLYQFKFLFTYFIHCYYLSSWKDQLKGNRFWLCLSVTFESREYGKDKNNSKGIETSALGIHSG